MAARTPIAHDIVGRQRECAEVENFLVLARDRARTLVIEGEAGIGKTRVWKEGLERAEAGGVRLLVSRPGGADVKLAFAGLADLIRDVDAEPLNELPPPQRRALSVALLLETGRGARHRPPACRGNPAARGGRRRSVARRSFRARTRVHAPAARC